MTNLTPVCVHEKVISFPDDSGFLCSKCMNPLKNSEVKVDRLKDDAVSFTGLGPVFINKHASPAGVTRDD